MRSPASRMSASRRIGNPASASSGMFGVTMCASGGDGLQRGHGRGLEQAIAALRDHDGIDHDRHAGARRQRSGDGVDDCGIGQHADLDGVGADVAEHRLDLLRPAACSASHQHAERVLRRDRGERARAVDAVRGKRLEIRLDPAPPPESLPAIVSAAHTLRFAPNVRSLPGSKPRQRCSARSSAPPLSIAAFACSRRSW